MLILILKTQANRNMRKIPVCNSEFAVPFSLLIVMSTELQRGRIRNNYKKKIIEAGGVKIMALGANALSLQRMSCDSREHEGFNSINAIHFRMLNLRISVI